MRNEAWANYIKDKRKKKKLTRRKLAELAKVDPSYLTLIERDGYIPRRDKITSFAAALEAESNEMFIMAGYIPENLPPEMKTSLQAVVGKGLSNELTQALQKLVQLDRQQQRKAASVILAFIEAIEM